MQRQKCSPIGLGDSNNAAHAVRHEIARIDPPPDRAGGDIKMLCYLADGVKIQIALTTAAAVAA